MRFRLYWTQTTQTNCDQYVDPLAWHRRRLSDVLSTTICHTWKRLPKDLRRQKSIWRRIMCSDKKAFKNYFWTPLNEIRTDTHIHLPTTNRVDGRWEHEHYPSRPYREITFSKYLHSGNPKVFNTEYGKKAQDLKCWGSPSLKESGSSLMSTK